MMSVGPISEKLIVAANQNAHERNYWLNQLAGKLVKTGFPYDHNNRKETGVHESYLEVLSFDFKEELVLKLLESTRASDKAINLVLISGLTVLLNKYTGCNDIRIGTPIYKQEMEGDFINTVLVLRNPIDHHFTFKDLLALVRQTILEGTRHQNYPLELLARELDIDSDTDMVGRSASLFDTAILLENIHDKKYLEHHGCNMTFIFKREEQGLRGQVEYNSQLYEKTSIKRIITHFEHLVYNALCHAHLPLAHLDMLTVKEKEQLLYDFNNTLAAYPHEKTIPGWFSEQVEKTPDQVAVSSPLDLSEIYDLLETGTTRPDHDQITPITPITPIIKTLCFKETPFIYRYKPGIPINGSDNRYLHIMKTHCHNSVLVNSSLLELLGFFDGNRNLGSIYSIIQKIRESHNTGPEFLIYSMIKPDLLEVTFRFNPRPDIFSIEGFADFWQLVRALYRNHLIRLVDVKDQESNPPSSGSEESLIEGFERNLPLALSGEDRVNPDNLLIRDKELQESQVLLLGDTPGLASVGLLYLASYLRRQGIESCCRFYDASRDYTSMKENLRQLLEKVRPSIVAISLKWFLYIARVLDMCKIVKDYARENNRDIKLVVGGNTASYYWENLIENDDIDYLVRGDGEVPLLEICRAEDEANIPNCVYKKNREIIENPITYVQDETASAEIYLSHLEDILLSGHASRFGPFFIYTHKGCAMNCLYCGGCNRAQQKAFNRGKVLKRGTAEVRKDIIAVLEYASTFQFEFDIPDENLLEYCRDIWAGIDLTGHFCIFSTLSLPSPQLIQLVSSTFKYVYWDFDICTPSQRHRQQLVSLGLVKPQPADEEILNFMARCESYKNLEVRLNLITGLPYFTPEDIEPGEKLLSKIMNTYSCFGQLHWARLHAQPGAPIVADAGKHHMHTLAASFADFLKYSKENFSHTSGYAAVEDFNYPYIYFTDDRLNSQVTHFYLEINKKAAQQEKERQRGLMVNKTLTYRQLNQKAGQLAGILKTQGIKSSSIVGLMLERSLEIPVGILGIMKAGGAYLPIDPEFPVGRIRYMLKDSNARVLVTSRSLDKQLNRDHETLLIDSVEESGFSTSHLLNFSTSRPSDPAYVIYTSGTTGKPKGVILDHRNLVNYVHWFSSAAGLSTADKTVLTSSFAFDLGYTSIYTSLLKGGELHILPREIYLLARRLLDYIRQKGITYIKMTPSLFSSLVNSPHVSGETCKTLRIAVIGGEAINVNDLEKAHSLCSHLQIMNHYGPTEAAIGCVATFVDFERFSEYRQHPVIGRPIANMGVYILDDHQHLLPLGVPGELCIAGNGLARGYLNHPQLTAQKFKNPRSNQKLLRGVQGGSFLEKSPPARRRQKIYKTGDLARWLLNGTVEFLGRRDTQVKVRGYRIELDEIENRLRAHSGLKDAVVQVREPSEKTETGARQKDDRYICAYIVPGEGEGIASIPEEHKQEKEHGEAPEFKKETLYSVVPLITRFEREAQQTPRQVIIESSGQSLTYESLDREADCLACQILAEYDDRNKLSGEERIRYKRQMLLHEWGMDAQEKLKAANVFVAGAGGGASPTIMQLALAGFGTIIVCDYDEVELSNLNRQFLHDESRLGMNKALSAQMTINRVNPHVRVIPITDVLTETNAARLIGDADIIFDMFDGLEAKFILSGYAVSRGIPHIISAMTDINAYTAIFHTPHTPCYHCIFSREKWEEIVSGMGQNVRRYKKNPLPVVATSLFMSSAFAVNEAIKIVLGFENPAYNKFIFFNQRGTDKLAESPSYKAMTYAFSDHFLDRCKEQGFDWEIGWRGNFLEELAIEPDPGCPLCGSGVKNQPYGQLFQALQLPQEKAAVAVEVEADSPQQQHPQTVAILLNPGISMSTVIIGALKAGKTLVPLDSAASMDELAFILEDSESRIILTDDQYTDRAEKLKNRVNKNIKIININNITRTDGTDKSDETVDHVHVSIDIPAEQPACMLYTADSAETSPFNSRVKEFYENLQSKNPPFRLPDNFPEIAADSTSSSSASSFFTALAAELRSYLQQELPEYMIPSYFVPLKAIPLTPNGKLDSNALPDPMELAQSRRPPAPPRNETEQKWLDIWADVLGIEKNLIGIDTSFFELGGHSLNAMVMTARVHKELNVKLSLAQVFTQQTIRALSELTGSSEEDVYVSIEPTEKKEYYLLSAAQNRMFLIKQLIGDEISYNTPEAYIVAGDMDKRHFEKVVMMLIQRQEAFRTSFEVIEKTPVQRIHPASSIDFQLEYREIPGDGTAIEQLIEPAVRDFIRPFDLAKAPLLRVGLVKLSKENHLLIYDFHHIIRDLVSTEIFVREFISLHENIALPPLRIQYKDYTAWQHHLFRIGGLKKREEYWMSVFSHAIPVLNMPLDYPRPEVLSFRGDKIVFDLGTDITGKLKHIQKESGASLYMIVLAIYNILLSRYSGQEDIIVGCPSAERSHADLENVVGILLNTLALRNFPRAHRTFVDFLEEVKTNTLDAFANQDFQFEDILSRLNIKPDPGRHPLFDTMLIWENVDASPGTNSNRQRQRTGDGKGDAEEIKGLVFKPYGYKEDVSNYDIVLHASEINNNISFTLRYCRVLFSRPTMENVTGHFKEIAGQIANNKYLHLKDIKICLDFDRSDSNILKEAQSNFAF